MSERAAPAPETVPRSIYEQACRERDQLREEHRELYDALTVLFFTFVSVINRAPGASEMMRQGMDKAQDHKDPMCRALAAAREAMDRAHSGPMAGGDA